MHTPLVLAFRYSPRLHFLPQKLNEEMQNMPLKELHAADPQAQSMVLSEDPLMFLQGSPLEQVLVEEVQNRPEPAVQSTPVPPHKQTSMFDVAPVVCVQSGAAMHRQKLAPLEVHDAVEVDLVLYLNLFCQKHPGG